MRSHSIRSLQAAMLVGAANIAIVGTAHAQTMNFDIPAQNLSSALAQYADATKKDLIYPPKLVANLKSKAVVGRHDAEDALKRMLGGTGISFRKVSENVYALQDGSERTSSNQGDASPGAVSGTVFNITTGTSVPGARVSIQGTDLETVTDERGQYYFPSVPPGDYVLEVKYLGEQPQTASIAVAGGMRQRTNIEIGEVANEIVVVGYRSSIQKALNKQRNADNNSTVVSSDLLGGFPAETVSEALRRVPGIAFGRDEETGEGSRITVRGFSSEAINVQLNGLELQGTGFERTIDLSGFLTDNISEITVHKSLLPSHEATGSGGLVEIETKSGLDYGDFSANFSIEGESNFDRDFGDEYQINGTIAKKLTPNFGIAASLQYRKTNRLNYTANVLDVIPPVLPAGYTSFFSIPASFDFPFDPDVDQQLIRSTTYKRSERAEKAMVGSVNIAWDVADHTRLRLDFQRNVNDRVSSSSGAVIGFLSSNIDIPIPELDNEVRRRTVLTSLRPSITLDTIDEKITSDVISFRGDTKFGRWEFEYKAGYSRSKKQGDNTSITMLGNTFTNLADLIDPATIVTNPDDDASETPRVVDGAFVTAGNGLVIPSLTAEGMALINDPSQYNFVNGVVNPIRNPAESYSGEFQARYKPAPDFLEYVEVGGKYKRDKRNTNGNVTNPRNVTSQRYLRISGRDTALSLFDNGVFDQNAFDNLGVPGFSIPFLTPSNARGIFEQLPNFVTDDPSTPDFNEERFSFVDFATLDPITDGSGSLTPTSTVEEKFAGYLESKFVVGAFSLIAGARYERERRSGTTLSAQSFRLNEPGFMTEPRETFVEAGLVDFEDNSGTVDTWTPSLLLTYRPEENIAARFGYFRSTVNPDFRLLNRGTNFSVDLRPGFERITILEANPNLKPSTTDNYDLDIAYYFNDSPGLVRAGLFYKKISNNFTNVAFTPLDSNDVRQRFLDRYGSAFADRPELLAIPEDAQLLVNRPENGEGGTIWGVELELIRRLDFLPGFLSDFGVLANATYTTGDFPTLVSARDDDGNTIQLTLDDRPLRDQPEWVYNLSLDYERDGFQGRVIYTRQSATAEVFDEFNLNTVVPAYDTLDLRISYSFERLGGLFSVFLEGDDLLRGSKSPDIRSAISSQFGTGDAQFYYPQSFQFNGGRAVTLGIRGRF